MKSRSCPEQWSTGVSCVGKLDWQFIGNIRLRGVTPRLRVLSDRQKSRPPSAGNPLGPRTLSLSARPLSSTRRMQVPGAERVLNISSHWQRFRTCCQCVPVTLFVSWDSRGTATSICISLASFRRLARVEWPPRYLNFIRLGRIRSCSLPAAGSFRNSILDPAARRCRALFQIPGFSFA